jgi:predicted transposase YdaD
MSNSHDSLFRALIDDAGRAGVLIRDYLPMIVASRLADEPPVLLDGTFIDPVLNASQSDRLFSVALRDGGMALLYILFEHKSAPDPFILLQLLGYRKEIWRRYVGTSAHPIPFTLGISAVDPALVGGCRRMGRCLVRRRVCPRVAGSVTTSPWEC